MTASPVTDWLARPSFKFLSRVLKKKKKKNKCFACSYSPERICCPKYSFPEVTMATASQDLHINHTYAKASGAVGEEIGRQLVTGSLCNVSDRHD